MGHGGQPLGYVFLPETDSDWPDYHRLQVTLRAVPTDAHFDPENVSLLARSASGGSEEVTVHHPWPREERFVACPGRVVLRDRRGKTIQAFTFGGEMLVQPEASLTLCTLQSPVPILALVRGDSASAELASEVEVVLATRRAAWDMRERAGVFDERLARVDPRDIYLASLQAVNKRLARLPHGESALGKQLAKFVAAELQGDEVTGWAGKAPELEDLL
jgi:hypothetical protein